MNPNLKPLKAKASQETDPTTFTSKAPTRNTKKAKAGSKTETTQPAKLKPILPNSSKEDRK